MGRPSARRFGIIDLMGIVAAAAVAVALAGVCWPVGVRGGAPGGSLERVGVARLESRRAHDPDHGERGPGVF